VITDLDNPSSWLPRFQLGGPVISCESAANAKGVPAEHELKSLLIDCDRGRVLAHVRGDRRLSLREIKKALALRQARLAAPQVLRGMGIAPGTLHPFHPALWPGVHLIARQVLAMPWVTTNAGKPDAYLVFTPLILLRATHLSVGDFEE
jgi:prolyl-tRNA editing enzyme YbaK/EbsC (Cys-tRNA(Pro) deacylase)